MVRCWTQASEGLQSTARIDRPPSAKKDPLAPLDSVASTRTIRRAVLIFVFLGAPLAPFPSPGLACIKRHAPRLARPAVRPRRDAAGRRAEERQADRQAHRPAAGRARGRRAVPSALRRDRPPRAAEDRRGRARRDRRHRSARRRAPPAAEPALQGAVQGAGRGRHRRRRAGVLSRQCRLDQEAPADRRDAVDFRQAGAVGRKAADGPSRPGDGRRGTRQDAGGRAGLQPDGRALPAHPRQGGPRRAGAAAKLPEWIDEADLRRLNAPASPKRCTRCMRPRRPPTSTPPGRRRRASPTTNCSPTSSRC